MAYEKQKERNIGNLPRGSLQFEPSGVILASALETYIKITSDQSTSEANCFVLTNAYFPKGHRSGQWLAVV